MASDGAPSGANPFADDMHGYTSSEESGDDDIARTAADTLFSPPKNGEEPAAKAAAAAAGEERDSAAAASGRADTTERDVLASPAAAATPDPDDDSAAPADNNNNNNASSSSSAAADSVRRRHPPPPSFRPQVMRASPDSAAALATEAGSAAEPAGEEQEEEEEEAAGSPRASSAPRPISGAGLHLPDFLRGGGSSRNSQGSIVSLLTSSPDGSSGLPSVDDWLKFAAESEGLSLPGAGQRKRSHSSGDCDLPPMPSEPAPVPPSAEDAEEPVESMAKHALASRLGHQRSSSLDMAGATLGGAGPRSRGSELPGSRVLHLVAPLDLPTKAPKGSRQHVKDLQAAIQELKLKNDTLTSVNVNLQEELFAIKEDRMFLERTLERKRAAHVV